MKMAGMLKSLCKAHKKDDGKLKAEVDMAVNLRRAGKRKVRR